MILSTFRKRARAAQLRRLRRTVHFLMKYTGMAGYCECLDALDINGHPGYVLVVYTHQLFPAAERESLRRYLQRKLTQLPEFERATFRLIMHDGHDLVRMRLQPAHVSSAKVAAIVRAANEREKLAPQKVQQRQAEMHNKMAENQWQRQSDIASLPAPQWAMTDLGQLESDGKPDTEGANTFS